LRWCQGETSAILYAGPKSQAVLKELSPGLELTVDYGILWFIAQPIFWLLQHIHSLVGNWGWSIIFLTMLIKGISSRCRPPATNRWRACVPWRRNWPR
jgi:YidC/Oxa1 family membrane protein insertase